MKKPDKRTIAVVTNLSFIIAGIGLATQQLVEQGVIVGLLGVLSAIHHAKFTDFTQKWDYAGMYMALLCIPATFGGLPQGIIVPTMLLSGGLLVLAFGASRILIGILISVGFICVIWATGVGPALEVASWISVAYAFNFIGDNIHRDYHSTIHGIPWHIPASYALYMAIVLV